MKSQLVLSVGSHPSLFSGDFGNNFGWNDVATLPLWHRRIIFMIRMENINNEWSGGKAQKKHSGLSLSCPGFNVRCLFQIFDFVKKFIYN